jgi:hypothetical protein
MAVSPGPLFGKEDGVGVDAGVLVPVDCFVPLELDPEDEFEDGAGVGVPDVAGAFLVVGLGVAGFGVLDLVPWFMFSGAIVVGVGPELFDTLW